MPISSYGLVDDDVCTVNVMVSLESNSTYLIVIIDFGRCRVRNDDGSDQDWGLAKRMAEEEELGPDMQHQLGEHGFELQYPPCQRYVEWAEYLAFMLHRPKLAGRKWPLHVVAHFQ